MYIVQIEMVKVEQITSNYDIIYCSKISLY